MTRPDFKRILIIATRQIGDVLCTTPLMLRSRELWPDAIIDVLGYEKTMGMLVGNPDINAVIESPEHPKWPEYKRLIRRIFRKYELAIVTQPSDRAHIYGLLAAPKRVGIVPTNRSHNWWKKLFSLHTVELDYWNQHVVIERLRLLDMFWWETNQEAKVSYPLTVTVTPPSAEPLPQDLIDFVGTGPIVVIHATPMWRFKRWPSESWAELISALVVAGMRVVLTGSSNQQDRALNAEILQVLKRRYSTHHLSKVRDCSAQLNLGQTANLLKGAHLYLGVDTSITHLAAACGAQTVAIFGATPPTNFGPWPFGGRVTPASRSVWDLKGDTWLEGTRTQAIGNVWIIQGPGSCVPCRKSGCYDHVDSRSQCLDEVHPHLVVEFLKKEGLL
ncbi:MAG: glycosyltransferase family 9 protein [Gammaproteobacteria bacterium]|nr:glycosyltransferase family 9 protein [Gammaproteobacteria bacterium]